MPKTKRASFPDRLAQIRKAKGLTQYDLAEMTGISHRMIVHYENHSKKLSPDVLIRLAKALNASIDELMGFKPTTEKEPPLKNRRLLKKLKVFDTLSSDDQKAILKHIEALSNKQ
jgi:transcriptional regulator with XRE-family HTH domain